MFRVGIVGCGGIARAHAEGYRTTGKAELSAFFDTDGRRAEAFAETYGGKAFTSIEEMMDRQHIDVVSICTPPSSHEEAACLAMRNRIDVCCEKPLAHTAAAARTMCRCADRTDALLVTAFKFRFFANVMWAKELIDGGHLGGVVFARNIFAGRIDMSERWFSKKEISGGGVMIDNGVHAIDLMRYLFGEVEGVFAVARNIGTPLDVEDTCRLLLNMSTGTWASVDLSWIAGQSRNILEIHGTKGLLELWWDGASFTPIEGEQILFVPPDDPILADPFAAQLDWFIACVRGEKRPRATAEDGLRALEIVERAYASATSPAWG